MKNNLRFELKFSIKDKDFRTSIDTTFIGIGKRAISYTKDATITLKTEQPVFSSYIIPKLLKYNNLFMTLNNFVGINIAFILINADRRFVNVYPK